LTLDHIDIDDKINATEALNPGSYPKVNLGAITKHCGDRTMAQKANLLSILEQHQALLQGNEANGRVIPYQLKS
jgi:hypothetical protein